MGAYETLKERGFIKQTTHENEIREALAGGRVTFYTGFDPTADSLHVGGMFQLIAMSHMQRAGHRPIALVGGGTGMVGDPTGKSELRKMMADEEVEKNVCAIKKQMARFIEFAPNNESADEKAVLVNNADWLMKLNYVDFIREYGVHFSVNRMLTADTYRTRFERGLSFFELNYMVMQSYDFLELNRRYGCTLEFGGDDQWSNILAGTELIRRVENKAAYGMTFTLLTTASGVKMGKTVGGAVWIDPDKTSPYDFYQYWRNIDDADVSTMLRLVTYLPIEEVNELSRAKDAAVNKVKERLAYEVTAICHGTDEAAKAQKAATAVFGGAGGSDDMPTTKITKEELGDGVQLTQVFVNARLAPTKTEARRNIEQGGVILGGVKVTDVNRLLTAADFDENGQVIVQKGKKVYHKIVLVNYNPEISIEISSHLA